MSDLMNKSLNALDEEHLRDVNGGAVVDAKSGISGKNLAEEVSRARILDKREMDIAGFGISYSCDYDRRIRHEQ